VDGRDYYFLAPEEFERRRREGAFLECAEVFGHWYGTLHSEVQKRRAAGKWVVLEIDVQGCLAVCRQYPDAVTIFLTTPSLDEYGERLRRRGTEDEQAIRRRVQTAEHELTFADRYQHRVVNDEVDRAVEEICQILQSVEAPHHA
jgi:guanylate kinase